MSATVENVFSFCSSLGAAGVNGTNGMIANPRCETQSACLNVTTPVEANIRTDRARTPALLIPARAVELTSMFINFNTLNFIIISETSAYNNLRGINNRLIRPRTGNDESALLSM